MNKNSLPFIISMFLLPSKNVFSIRSGYNINFVYNFVVGIQTDITIIEYKIILTYIWCFLKSISAKYKFNINTQMHTI